MTVARVVWATAAIVIIEYNNKYEYKIISTIFIIFTTTIIIIVLVIVIAIKIIIITQINIIYII